MNRKEKRDKKEEINILKDLINVINQYFPELISKFNGLTDLRNQSYVKYQMKVIFIVRLMGLMCEMKSMQGFNIQKNGIFDIGHLYSKNQVAIKVHYLMIQIAHILRQLLEKGIKEIKELRLKLKEISQMLKKRLTSKIIAKFSAKRKIQLRLE